MLLLLGFILRKILVFFLSKTKIHNYFEAIVYLYNFINSLIFKKEHHQNHPQKHLLAQFFDQEKHHLGNLHS